MPKLEEITPGLSRELNRRSFLHATGIIAAATMTGGLPSRPLARRSAARPPNRRSAGGASSGSWKSPRSGWAARISPAPYMLDNICADSVRFTPGELTELNAALLRTPVHGARLPQMVLSLSSVEAPPKR